MTIAAGKTPFHSYFPAAAMAPEALDWEFMSAAHLTVQDDSGATLVEGADYSIDGDSTTGNATITALVDAGAAEWFVWSDTPAEQQLDLTRTVAVDVEQYERELDRLEMQTREDKREIARAPRVPRGTPTVDFGDLSDMADGDILVVRDGLLQRFDRASFAGKFLAGDGTGGLIPASGTGADAALRTDLASTIGALMVSTVLASADAYAITVERLIKAEVNLLNFIPEAKRDAWLAHTLIDDVSDHWTKAVAFVGALGGGTLTVPSSTSYIKSVPMLGGVNIRAAAGNHGYLAGVDRATSRVNVFLAAGGAHAFDTPVGGASLWSIEGIDFQGLGAGTGNRAIRLQAGSWWVRIARCSFNGFGDQAILNYGVALKIDTCHAVNCLLNRSLDYFNGGAARAENVGVIDDRGTDTQIYGACEFSASMTAGEGTNGVVSLETVAELTGDTTNGSTSIANATFTSGAIGNLLRGMQISGAGIPAGARLVKWTGVGPYTLTLDVPATATAVGAALNAVRLNLYLAAVNLGGANASAEVTVVAELSECGFRSNSNTNKVFGRADRNAGHGFVGFAQWNGKCNDNSYFGAGIYDNINLDNVQATLVAGVAAINLVNGQTRYGLSTLGVFGAVSARNRITSFLSRGHAIAPILNDPDYPHEATAGRCFLTENAGTTPNLSEVGFWERTDAAPTTITALPGGIHGQDVYFRPTTDNITMQNDAATLALPVSPMRFAGGRLYHFHNNRGVFTLIGEVPMAVQEVTADAALTVAASRRVQVLNEVTATNFTLTLSTVGAKDGDRFLIIRTAAASGAGTLTLAGLLGGATKTFAAGTQAWAVYSKDLGGWVA